jgi:DNA (cytosine-5)-methyltransferase 1
MHDKLKAIDFFCGTGGMTCGFIEAGIEVLAGIDYQKGFKDTYEKNNSGAKYLCKDLFQYTPEELEDTLGIGKNDKNLVFIACSPCQYRTNMYTDKSGKSSVSKDLLNEFNRFVRYFNPGYIVLENVPGFLKNKTESPLGIFKADLLKNNYLYDEDVLNAKYFGVPQNRRRYILIAAKNKKLSLPKPNKEELVLVEDVIGDEKRFPPISAGDKKYWRTPQHYAAPMSELNMKRIKNTSHNGGNRLEWKDNSDLQLSCYIGKDNQYTDYYGRMFWKKHSPTITTKFIRTSNGRYGHPVQNRALSLREGAALQTFPDNYKFYSDSIGEIAMMIGNAVPPQFAKVIGESLIDSDNTEVVKF